ncbi:hypothetical protein FE810_11795 [Thalassotalea litorea]|uniref:Uncharacterized protein n=1 Tax=Thalassotalea litorea TaxID=2020715 RepID=A0A5R9IG74_9GAMM|nr:DUF6776 family protein [Thalassotalea litorea]TLU64282.1 hypothetical protein FE810_11795 [Thalassotalea litorea]
MNWLKKITFAGLHHRFGAFKLWIFTLITILVISQLAYRVGNFYQGHQEKIIVTQNERLERLYRLNEEQQSKINILNVELEIERLANQDAMENLDELEKQQFELKKQLAFYEKIMAPEKQAQGFVIDEVLVSPSASENHYRLKVVLVQQLKSKRFASGHIEVEFVGSLNNRPATIKLANVSELDSKKRSFNFRYFQVIEGDFNLPKGFVPEKIEVAAILPAKGQQKYRRLQESYPWPEQEPSLGN